MQRRPYYLITLAMVVCLGFSFNVRASTVDDARKAYQSGDINRALNEVNIVLQTEPDNVSALFLKAQISSSNKQNRTAIESYQKLIALAPNHLEAYNNLATLYAQQGKLELASKTLEDAIRTDPVYSTIHGNLRAIYMDMSKKHYRMALKLKPEDSQSRLLAVNTRNSSDNIISKEVPIGMGATQAPANTTLVANTSKQAVLPSEPSTERLTEGAKKEMAPTIPKAAPKTKSEAILQAKSDPKPDAIPQAKLKPKPKAETKPQPKPILKPAPKVVVATSNVEQPEKPPTTVAKVNTVPATATSNPAQEIKTALLAWANAWSNRDPNKYVNAYRAEYATQGKTNEDWVAGRRWNFKTKKYIKVALSNISIKAEGNKYRAFFRQAYESDTFKDVVNKEILFIRQNGGWKIAIERAV